MLGLAFVATKKNGADGSVPLWGSIEGISEALTECIYAFDALANFDGLHGLLLLFDGHLRDDDVEDAVFDLGADLLLVDVLR